MNEMSNLTPAPKTVLSQQETSQAMLGAGMDQSGAAGAGGPGVADAGAVPSTVQTEPRPSTVPVGTGSQPTPSPQGGASVSRFAARRLPDPSKVNTGWWIFAILLFAVAVVCSVVVAWGTAFSHAHRLSAAGAALLDVAALATLAHVILLWYQSTITSGPAANPAQETLNYRRRGLKAAVIGQDGRASTSKTQVAVWTGAVVWALIDLLLLVRANPGGDLFTAAVTSNWRPEYLVLLGLPVAAAVTAKAVVSGSNNGQGPLTSSPPAAVPDQAVRIYQRKPLPAGVKGFVVAVAELITADDGTVAWADLQYVVFTLITLVYFLVQVLAQPQNGLPPVPAALLTLMGVSASGYTVSKIVETQGTVPLKAQGQAKEG
jgi:hypothetical protein